MPHQCQTCSNDFAKYAELHEHVEFFKNRARALTFELLKCLAHTTSEDSIYAATVGDVNDVNADTYNELCIAEGESEEGGSETTSDLDTPSAPGDNCLGNGQGSGATVSRDLTIACPRLQCNAKFPSRTRMHRHYQTHVECSEKCDFCKRMFKRVSLFMDHKCANIRGENKHRLLAKRKRLRVMARKDQKNCIAERATMIADKQPSPSPSKGKERLGSGTTEANTMFYGNDYNAVSADALEDVHNIAQSLANAAHPDTSSHVANQMAAGTLEQLFMPPGPSRGSIFGRQNIGFAFADESPTEARGSLFFARRLGGSWPFPDGYSRAEQSVGEAQHNRTFGDEGIDGNDLNGVLGNTISL